MCSQYTAGHSDGHRHKTPPSFLFTKWRECFCLSKLSRNDLLKFYSPKRSRCFWFWVKIRHSERSQFFFFFFLSLCNGQKLFCTGACEPNFAAAEVTVLAIEARARHMCVYTKRIFSVSRATSMQTHTVSDTHTHTQIWKQVRHWSKGKKIEVSWLLRVCVCV